MNRPPTHPRHPERICWGCDKYCPVDDMACGNGKVRSPHPVELFGDDWNQQPWLIGWSADPAGAGDEAEVIL